MVLIFYASIYLISSLLILLVIKLFAEFTIGTCDRRHRLDGKTVIVTGANSGIGLETARDLSARGARVVLACRSKFRGLEAMQSIIRSTGNRDIKLMELDLASLKSVRQFCATFIAEEDRLDVLVLNAGLIVGQERILTEDNFKTQFQSNHLGHFLMLNLLSDTLKQSAPSRVVVVSSILNFFGQIDFNNLQLEKSVPEPFWTYSNTKLMNILMTKEASRRLSKCDVTVNACHPGLVVTDINKDRPWYVRYE